jgi:hypothetical protein
MVSVLFARAYPLNFNAVEYMIGTNKKNRFGRRDTTKKELPKKEREQTPIDFAKYLIQIAELCNKNNQK